MSDRHFNSSNHVTLYVKTGSDGFSYGACPACQRIYMILELKARGGSLTYDIHYVNMSKPTLEFKKFSNRLPVLIHEDEVIRIASVIEKFKLYLKYYCSFVLYHFVKCVCLTGFYFEAICCNVAKYNQKT